MLDRLSLPLRVTLESGLMWLEQLPRDEQREVAEALAQVLNAGVRGTSTPAEVAARLDASLAAMLMRQAHETRESQLRVAYHEAGHAIAACAGGLTFKTVSIVSDDVASLGRVMFADGELRPVRNLAHADSIAIMELCGPEGERLGGSLGPHPDTVQVHTAYAGDTLALAPELSHWSIEARGRRQEMLLQRARDLLAENRRWVERVATALRQNARLTQDDVWALSAEPLTLAA